MGNSARVVPWQVLLWFGGFLLGTFLVVTDEILAVALYCQGCGYNFPVIGVYPIWHAWEITFGAIVISIVISFVSLIRVLGIRRDVIASFPSEELSGSKVSSESGSYIGVLPGLRSTYTEYSNNRKGWD